MTSFVFRQGGKMVLVHPLAMLDLSLMTGQYVDESTFWEIIKLNAFYAFSAIGVIG